MFRTQSANWYFVIAFVVGLATNYAGFAYGGPGCAYGNCCPGGQCRYPSLNQPRYANPAYSEYPTAAERLRFSRAALPVRGGGEIVLFSPSGTLREAQYALNGVPYVMEPGTMQRLKNDRVWNVEVSTGTGQVMRYTLAPGGYKFQPTGLGMSMGLFATQERPEVTTVASPTWAVPSGPLAASIGTPTTTAAPPIPMYDLMTAGQGPTPQQPAAIAAPPIPMYDLMTAGQGATPQQPAAIAVSPIPMYGRAEPRLAHTGLQKRFGERAAPMITASQWINTSHAISLEQFRDKVVLLDFWGNWCGPCVRNLPKVQALHEKYKDRGLVVIGVHSAHGAESVAAFLARHSYSFPVAVDTGDTAERYRVEGWPTYFLIDKSGNQTRFAHEPPHEQQIEHLLRQ